MLTDEQIMIRDMARDFARSRLAPTAGAREAAGAIEPEIVAELTELGFLGMTISPDWGGAGADYTSYALALTEIAAGDGAVSTLVSVHNAPVCAVLDRFGSEAQKARWLRPLTEGGKVGSFALTEPQAGSDAANLKTRAVRSNEGYRVTGAKQFISSARIGWATVLFAVTDPEKGKKGISCFVVENAAEGFEIVRVESKLGQKASDSCALAFTEMFVPFEDRIGEEGQGYAIALSSLEAGRIGIAAQAVGLAQGAYERALAYAQERTAFGGPIFDLQAVQFRLAEMATDLEAARQLVLNAAAMKDRGEPCLKEACMAKLFAAQAAERVTSEAIQVLGGYGYLADYEVERIYRDQKVCQIYEGTNDIQKLIIARQIRG
ncbi:acyl-CoA dehydrogenase family protein [Paralimibaculum aggregatum]|uniref:Acyl-CoA dehydrogenase family protein n=1 Tax=Paralimibaculum aggregatum TaxID=3036245 RepID=A0ABQ6LG33_9RHOB|nr:acyl-CoA dehydrogenase family protein [Limibaculum sp. NKW23]GMG82277.1 acyl-CoA dehydrogenase family protein [Limibaculum sp. NKW23]